MTYYFLGKRCKSLVSLLSLPCSISDQRIRLPYQTMHNIRYVKRAKTLLRQASVKIYHPQGVRYAKIKPSTDGEMKFEKFYNA